MLLATITELCRAELNNGQHELADWIEKKSNAAWVSREGARTFIAESEGEILGVGMVDLRGGILLCYVRPDARFFGISKVILKSLDEFARSKHVQKCSLEITKTAIFFHESCSYRAAIDSDPILEKTP